LRQLFLTNNSFFSILSRRKSKIFSKEGRQQIAISNEPPDLILLEVMMPGIDGYEVCRRLRENRITNDITVIFLTAKAEVEEEQMGLELGAVDYITKRVSPPILLASIRTYLRLKRVTAYLKGKLDDIRIYDAAMTDEQVKVLYAKEVAKK
jgi:putative two-component system response regulator